MQDSVAFTDLQHNLAMLAPEKRAAFTVVVVDNTDSPGWQPKMPELVGGQAIQYIHLSNNPGLSVAYNTALRKLSLQVKWLCTLDQDTRLPTSYITELHTATSDDAASVVIPNIIAAGVTISPFNRVGIRAKPLKSVRIHKAHLPAAQFGFINSGACFRISVLTSIGGFNEKLRLDFVDHDLCARLSSKVDSWNLLPVSLDQQLSINSNTFEQDKKRYLLFVEDLKQYNLEHGNSFQRWIMVDLPHLFALTFKHKNLHFIWQRLGLR